MWADTYKAGKTFFTIMQKNEESLKFLKYDINVQFNCGDNAFVVKVKAKRVVEIKEGRHDDGIMDLTLIADDKIFMDLFRGRISPATALYHGKIRIPAQKPKHSLITALFQSMRKNQEDLYSHDWEEYPAMKAEP